MYKNARFVYILFKNDAKKRLIVIFSILLPLFHKLCVLDLPSPLPPGGISFNNRHWVGGGGGESARMRDERLSDE